MNCNPTLTADEFRIIHNAMCDLDSVCRQLEGVLDPELYEKLIGTAGNIRSGLKGAYEQDRQDGDSKFDHYRDVQKQLGLEHSVWSIYTVKNLADRHPFEGVDRVVYRDHWGKKPVSCSVNGLTWAALWIAANACVRDSGDEHHMFIESFQPDAEDPRTLVMTTGS